MTASGHVEQVAGGADGSIALVLEGGRIERRDRSGRSATACGSRRTRSRRRSSSRRTPARPRPSGRERLDRRPRLLPRPRPGDDGLDGQLHESPGVGELRVRPVPRAADVRRTRRGLVAGRRVARGRRAGRDRVPPGRRRLPRHPLAGPGERARLAGVSAAPRARPGGRLPDGRGVAVRRASSTGNPEAPPRNRALLHSRGQTPARKARGTVTEGARSRPQAGGPDGSRPYDLASFQSSPTPMSTASGGSSG